MMTPDLAMIAEVMLAAEGFREARVLAKKTVTLYNLMIQQLSKQVRFGAGQVPCFSVGGPIPSPTNTDLPSKSVSHLSGCLHVMFHGRP